MSFVSTDAVIVIDGVDLSDQCNQLSLSYEAETQDDTTFGNDTRSNVGGLKNWGVEATFLQDEAAGQVGAILFALVGTTATISIKETSAAVSASNPDYGEGVTTGLISSAPPMGNSVGDLATTSVTIIPGGASPTLTRGIT